MPNEYADVMADPIMEPYVQPYIGSKELIQGRKRWCLWLQEMDPSAPSKSVDLRKRIQGVETERLKSTAQSTRDYARFPHLFRQVGIVSEKSIVGIPEVSSENRRYLPVAHLEPGTIISNKVYGAEDPDGTIFAIASSSMFLTWMKTVGGRLEYRLSFSSTVTWNNFPLPHLEPEQRSAIVAAGKKILAARRLHADWSLDKHYAPLGMNQQLVKAHDALDSLVDKALGAPRRCRDERERQHYLFESYAALSSS